MMSMQWELAHRPRDTDQATPATIDAPDSRSAIEQLRTQISAGDVDIYVRAAR